MKVVLIISSLIFLNFPNVLEEHTAELNNNHFKIIKFEQQKFNLTQLVGIYEIKDQGYYIEITLKEGDLYAKQSWNEVSYIIKREKNNTFIGESNKKFIFSDLKDNVTQYLKVMGERKATFTRKQSN